MDGWTKNIVVRLYREGNSIRKTSKLINEKYGRETVRKILHEAGVRLRGSIKAYVPLDELTTTEKEDFAEILGYFYGDGSLSKSKNSNQGDFTCGLTLAENEKDLVTRVCSITQKIFRFTPKVKKFKGYYFMKFRRSFGNYLDVFGYPVGKKSMLNPHFPTDFLDTDGKKISFVRGFMNAEASVYKSISVHQSVRIYVSDSKIRILTPLGSKICMKGQICYLISWKKAKEVIGEMPKKSNMLEDLKIILDELGMKSKIYPLRIYVGHAGVTSIHFELRILKKYIKRALDLRIVSSKKKLKKLQMLCGGSKVWSNA
ncbi:hypothetical protein GOV11_00475 [Candidatus Woesearchaeota archaeon]|nr:hypothetical protein [Candidatus Woesearchaeota archaeon]